MGKLLQEVNKVRKTRKRVVRKIKIRIRNVLFSERYMKSKFISILFVIITFKYTMRF